MQRAIGRSISVVGRVVELGIHSRLKICRELSLAGSNPAVPTCSVSMVWQHYGLGNERVHRRDAG